VTCGERGAPGSTPVDGEGVLTATARRRVQVAHYRFCRNPVCDTVYVGDDADRFSAQEITSSPVNRRCDGASGPTIEALDRPRRVNKVYEAR